MNNACRCNKLYVHSKGSKWSTAGRGDASELTTGKSGYLEKKVYLAAWLIDIASSSELPCPPQRDSPAEQQ